jgi:RNA recognition motif-containing protein
MHTSHSFNVLSSLCNNRSTRNLIEFNNIYENIQHEQQKENHGFIPIIKPSRNQVPSSTCSSSASSLSINSFSGPLSSDSIMSVNSSSKQSDYRKLFVGNLPSNTKLGDILEFFKKYGPINEKLSVVKDQNYAFVHFYNEEDAKIALKGANDSLFKNRYIRVQFSTSQAHIKKSKTFDASNGLFKETAISPPSSSSSSSIIMTEAQKIIQPNMRPITKSSNKSALKRSTTDFNIIQQQQQSYYSPFQYSQLFEMDLILAPSSSTATTNQMTKSATFQY